MSQQRDKKNGLNACGNQQYHCKTCGAYGVLEPQNRYTEEEKDLIIKAYQERSSMRGIERTHGVCRQTLSAWLKKKRSSYHPLKRHWNLSIPRKYLCWKWMNYGLLSFARTTKSGYGLQWTERPEKSLLMPAVIAAKTPAEYSGIAYHPLIKKALFLPIILFSYDSFVEERVVVNFDVIAWFTHNAKLRLIANCRLRDHSRITHYPFTQSLQKLPLPIIENSLVGFINERNRSDQPYYSRREG